VARALVLYAGNELFQDEIQVGGERREGDGARSGELEPLAVVSRERDVQRETRQGVRDR